MSLKLLATLGALAALCNVSLAQLDTSELGLDWQPEEDPAGEAQPIAPKSFFQGWTGSIEAGLTGSSGNTEEFNVRASVLGERKTAMMITRGAAIYTRSQENGETTKNRFEAYALNEWRLAKDSPWRYFIGGTYEYDDFQDWQQRVWAGNGLGYAFIENEKTTLIGRAGVGARREFGGLDEDWTPEAIFGVEFSHKLTERQKISASCNYYPSLERFADDYRTVTRAAYEILVDPENKLSLKLGLEHRYDNTPGPGVERDDLDYFALLVWSF